ncbi:MAG: DUF3367 domain-containing protein, partial [Micromonosporaceae bacterium]|nr:DUF3367 domain-containing protein [Micromonosporaceae bacterium]
MSTRSGVPVWSGILGRTLRAAGTGATRQWPVFASLVALTVISFVQLPGKTTFDTKLDLAVRPADFLGRALRMWNPEATFGELQNQAYGYLFPIGPFFVLADLAGIPTWVAQRLWCALLLGAAFLGVVLLARALRIGSEPARIIAGLAYALAPRMLTEIGTLSSEMLPAAFLPWALLPLVRAERIGVRRAAALSGVAVLCMSGVNAAMVLMALPLPGIWLLTREWTRQHVRLVAWWCGCVVLATLWWTVPLLLLGRYSLPFLDYVESAANTTAPLSQFQALRGTNQWVAYVVSGEPWWPAGWTLVDSPALMVATGLIAAISLAGLARRNLPERRFLLLGMLGGLVLLTLGHVGALDSPIASQWRELLDGPLAPFRNVHKFDPMLRLTLALGFAHGAGVAWPSVSRRRLELALTGLLVVAVAAPAWLLMLRPGPGWDEIPAYWKNASGWLAEHNPDHRTLLVPAMGFGEYEWGRTVDEPMQPLAESPWAIRNQIPLGSEGNTRFLDTVESALVNGRGSPALAAYLARAGVRHVLVRNDVYRAKLDAPSLQLIHSALAASPGIAPVRSFGPQVRLDAHRGSSLIDLGRRPALEIYEVSGPIHRVSAVAVDDALTVSGGPESVLPLLEQGLLAPDQPAILAGEPAVEPVGPRVITDGLRRQERNVGRVHDNVSETLADTDPVRQQRPALDLLPLPGEDRLTTADYDGVRSVRASTAASYADAYGSSDPSYLPFSAFDGDPATLWRSSSLVGPVGQWLEVELDTPRVFDSVRIRFSDDVRIAWPVSRIRISTELGSQEHEVPEGPDPHTYAVPPGPTSTLRITVTRMVGDREDGNVGIQEIDIPNLDASRSLRVATAGPGTGPPSLAFTRGSDPRPACFQIAGQVRCDAAVGRHGEEPLGINRRFVLPEGARYRLSATALPRPGGAPSLPAPGAGLKVSATSHLAGDPATSPFLATDGDPDTAWLADVTDPDPTLRLRWKGARSIDRLSLRTPTSPRASRPIELTLRTLHKNVTVQVPDSGEVRFPAITTDHLDVDFLVVAPTGLDPHGRVDEDATLGIAELTIPALADLAERPAPDTRMELPCGAGPTLLIDSKLHRTKL